MLLVFAVSCGGSEEDADPQAACEDFGDAFVAMCTRCLDTEANCRAAIEDTIDCSTVVGLRDEDEFYQDCLPWMSSVACSYVQDEAFELDSSCEGQLLVR